MQAIDPGFTLDSLDMATRTLAQREDAIFLTPSAVLLWDLFRIQSPLLLYPLLLRSTDGLLGRRLLGATAGSQWIWITTIGHCAVGNAARCAACSPAHDTDHLLCMDTDRCQCGTSCERWPHLSRETTVSPSIVSQHRAEIDLCIRIDLSGATTAKTQRYAPPLLLAWRPGDFPCVRLDVKSRS
jgi:hypothetical protein